MGSLAGSSILYSLGADTELETRSINRLNVAGPNFSNLYGSGGNADANAQGQSGNNSSQQNIQAQNKSMDKNQFDINNMQFAAANYSGKGGGGNSGGSGRW